MTGRGHAMPGDDLGAGGEGLAGDAVHLGEDGRGEEQGEHGQGEGAGGVHGESRFRHPDRASFPGSAGMVHGKGER
jgi:hypothetical protein